MPWAATLLTFMGFGSIAYSLTLLDRRRRARSFYGFLTIGTALALCGLVWWVLSS